MDITNYINQKNKCCVFNLTKNRAILNELNLADYPNSDKYKKSTENIFSEKDLVIFVIDSHKIKNRAIFEIANKLNNVLVYIIDDTYMQDNETQCKNIFFSYGYKYKGKSNDNKVLVFIYDIVEYKEKTD